MIAWLKRVLRRTPPGCCRQCKNESMKWLYDAKSDKCYNCGWNIE